MAFKSGHRGTGPKWKRDLLTTTSPRISAEKRSRAGLSAVGLYPANNGVSIDHASRFAHIPHVPTISSPRSPRGSYQRVENRKSSVDSKKNGVSFDAPQFFHLDYIRVHTPSAQLHKHRSFPPSCRPGASTAEIIAMPAFYITSGMLPGEKKEMSLPISNRVKKDFYSDSDSDTTPPITPRTQKTPTRSRLTWKYDEKIGDKHSMSNSPRSPLQNRLRTRSFFPDEENPSLLASADEKTLQKYGNYCLDDLRRSNHILGPLLRDNQHPLVYQMIHGSSIACSKSKITHDAIGKKKIIPPHLINHGADVVLRHIGEGRTPRSMMEGGFCSMSPTQKRGHRKQFNGGSSGGVSTLMSGWNGRLG